MFALNLSVLTLLALSIQRTYTNGIRREDAFALTGMERISKREANNNDIASNLEDMDTAANTIIFKPFFRNRNSNSRVLRSVEEEDFRDDFLNTEELYRGTRDIKENQEDMDTAANTIIFKPLFRHGNAFRRTRRSVDEEARVERSANSPGSDDMDTAANTIIFRPLFRRGNNRNRRSIDEESRVERSANTPDDMETAANTIIFKPLFRRGNGFRRARRSIDTDSLVKRSADQNDLDTAANTIIFKPLFRHRNNFNRFRRSIKEDEPEERFVRSAEPQQESMETAANTLIFKPLFRRKLNRL